MLKIGDKVRICNENSKYYNLNGEIINIYPKQGFIHVKVSRPFELEDGRVWKEILYIPTSMDNVELLDSCNSLPIDTILNTIYTLAGNYKQLNDEDKERLGSRYIKYIKELVENN